MVLVFGFTKAAAKVTRPWLEGCRAAATDSPASADARCYDVRMLEDVPKPFRGMTERAMRSGLPVPLQGHALLVYAENDAWRERLRAADTKTAYVIGCDAQGVVRRVTSGAHTDAELKQVLEAIAPSTPTEPAFR